MNARGALPSLFVASFSEGLPVACDVQEALEHDGHVTVWQQGVFAPSRTVMQELLHRTEATDFALFVFTPDDLLTLRGATLPVARDNVVFETGLFIGALGLPRCMHLVPRGQTLHLPSDLLGLIALDDPADRPDGNRLAALGPACSKISRRFREVAAEAAAAPPPAAARAARTLADYRADWSGPPLADDRALLRAGVVLDPCDEDFPRAAVLRMFHFLESMADAVLSGAIDETQARAAFGPTLLVFWPHAATLLAPPNHADDFWLPLPRIAELFARWRA